MGIADMLIKLGYTYGSPDSLAFCSVVASSLTRNAIEASSDYAAKYGSYPMFNADTVLSSSFFKQHADDVLTTKIKTQGLANSQILTIAPTGTLSTMLQISGGIEPIFAIKYTRTTKSLHDGDKIYEVYTKIAQDWLNEHPEEPLPEYFVESSQIAPENRIKMQALWHNYIDASISSTLNLPESATIEDVENIYMMAWKQRLKGITIFRQNCKRVAILQVEPKKEETSTTKENLEVSLKSLIEETDKISLPRGKVIKAPENCIGMKRLLMTGCGSLHLLAYFDPETGNLMETYFSKGSQGGCEKFMVGLSRMVSLAARGGVDIHQIVDQLKSSGTCPAYAVRRATKGDTSKGSSCPVAIGNALLEMHEEFMERRSHYLCINSKVSKELDSKLLSSDAFSSVIKGKIKCPECGGELTAESGCFSCKSCGFSKCE